MASSGSERKPAARDKYLMPVACKTLDVLEACHSPRVPLSLEQIIARTRIAHTKAFRIRW